MAAPRGRGRPVPAWMTKAEASNDVVGEWLETVKQEQLSSSSDQQSYDRPPSSQRADSFGRRPPPRERNSYQQTFQQSRPEREQRPPPPHRQSDRKSEGGGRFEQRQFSQAGPPPRWPPPPDRNGRVGPSPRFDPRSEQHLHNPRGPPPPRWPPPPRGRGDRGGPPPPFNPRSEQYSQGGPPSRYDPRVEQQAGPPPQQWQPPPSPASYGRRPESDRPEVPAHFSGGSVVLLSRKRESSDSDDQRPKVIRQDSGQQVETEEDIKRETRHRDSVRVLQNEGTDAYQKRDFERSRDRFDRALALHETYLEAKLLSGQPAPSRMLAERDAVKCKLLKYLSRALAKLGREDESKEKLDEAVVIEQRLADYEKRKKDHKRMQVESL